MVINKIRGFIFCGLLFCQIFSSSKVVYGTEQTLLLKFRTQAIEKTEDIPIGDLALSIADVNHNNRNEIAISGNGYIHIFEWNGTTFESKWKSPQYFHQLGPITLNEISRLVTTNYYSGNKLETDYLIFVPPVAKASDIYRLNLKNNKYNLQKMTAAPFNWFGLGARCSDGSSVILGYKFHPNGNYAVLYKWNGAALIEKWSGSPGTDVKVSGEMRSTFNKAVNIFLVQDKQRIGILSCNNDVLEWKEVGKDPGTNDLWRGDRIWYGKNTIGFTKKGSIGDLWSIQYPQTEAENYAKLYVSQFDGKRFSPFSRVYFKGIDSDMIFNMIIADVDNDGVGEILGVEEKIRKVIPRKHQPGDTGEESDTLLITSNLFLAKWNGKEYEIKWHKKAIDERVSNIAVEDITGDGNKEILITDDNGYLYVFDMPGEK